MRILIRWAIGIVVILVTVQIMSWLPEQYQQYRIMWPSVWGIVIFVPVLAVANVALGSILRLLTVPISCLTFGLFGFVINAIVFWIAGWATGAQNGLGQSIGFVGSLLGSIIYTVISTPLSAAIGEN